MKLLYSLSIIALVINSCGSLGPEYVKYSNGQTQSVDACEASVQNFEANLISDLSGSCTGCHVESGSAANFSFRDKSSSEIIQNLLSDGSNWNSSSWLKSASHNGSSAFEPISTKWEQWISVQESCE